MLLNSFCTCVDRIGRVFGPCFSGLVVAHSTVHDLCHNEDEARGGQCNTTSACGPRRFSQGTSHELSCTELLFDLQSADFRKQQADLDLAFSKAELRLG